MWGSKTMPISKQVSQENKNTRYGLEPKARRICRDRGRINSQNKDTKIYCVFMPMILNAGGINLLYMQCQN